MIKDVFLKEISMSKGISSFEDNVAEIVKRECISFSDSIVQDGLGSVIVKCNVNCNGPRIMLATHMDEIGFIVKEINSRGFIFLHPIGSWWTHMLLGQTYIITTQSGKQIEAISGSIATHGLPSNIKEKTIAMSDVYLDLGVSNKEEVEQLGIQIGDMVTPFCQYRRMNNPKYICSKAFDDRIGVAIGIDLCQNLKKQLQSSFFFAATVQEEPGLRGARTATDIVKPDLAFAIDTTLAGDTPHNNNECRLGGGVVLSMLDSNSLAHRGLLKYVEKICKENKIPYQYAVFNKGGTDSGNIHKSLAGVINMTLSIPIRYMHTHQSIIHEDDVEACVQLLTCILEEMNTELFNQLV